MADAWESDPVVSPWESDPIESEGPSTFGRVLHWAGQHGVFGLGGYLLTRDTAPNPVQHEAHGFIQAGEAGYEGSVTGLVTRGTLPEVVLDAHHARWYEKLASSIGQLAGDFPAMVGGGALAGLAGIESGPGAAVAGGAAAFAAPTAIRSALIEAYSKGSVQNASDFLDRTSIVLKQTGKDALIGGLTGGAGYGAGKLLTPMAESLVSRGVLSANAANVATGIGKVGAEYGTMTVAPAALEGRLPEPDDFVNGAILIAGLHGAHLAAEGLGNLYARTGVLPEQAVADAKADPTITEDLAKPEAATEVPRTYQPLAAETAAADAFPGTKAQAVLDSPFADIPETKLPHQLNLEYIEGPEDLKALQTRMAETYREEIDAARGGTQGWAETEAKAARQVADMTGQDLAKVMAGRKPGDTSNAVQLQIMGDILMKASVEAGAAIKRVKDAGADATDAMRADALAAIHRMAMIQADFTGASSELGRALQYLQRIKDVRNQGEGISKLVDLYGNDPQKLLEMASELNTPEGLARFAQRANKATTWDQVMEGWRAGLLGPITCVKKALSDITIMASRPLVDAVAVATNRLSGSSERMSAVEPLARIIGNVNGAADGLVQAWAALKTEHMGGVSENRGAIPGVAGEIIRTPYRAIEAVTALFRAMEERGEAYTQAARRAAAEGFDPRTREFAERVAEYATNQTEQTAAQVEAFGKRMTFSAPLGDKARAFSNAVRTFHAEPIFPFLKAPTNVFKEQTRLSPMAPLVGEWRSEFSAGGISRSKAVAEMAVGSALAGLGMAWAASGHISGGGDPDPNKNRIQRAAGWQPYSVKIGNTWYSTKMIHPIGTLLGVCADVHDMADQLTDDEHHNVFKLLGKAFSHAVTEQTFLQGMTNLVNALNSPEKGWTRLSQDYAASLVPAVIGQPAQMMDSSQREIYSILDAVKARIPGFRETLQPQRDPFGEPVSSPDRFGGITPITERVESEDKVRTEAARLGVGVAQAPKSIQLPSAGQRDIGKVDLTPEQRDVFSDVSGHMAYHVLDGMVNSPGWDYMPDMVKRQAFNLVFEHTRKMGQVAALSDEQRQVEIRRITAAVSQRMKKGTS